MIESSAENNSFALKINAIRKCPVLSFSITLSFSVLQNQIPDVFLAKNLKQWLQNWDKLEPFIFFPFQYILQ